MTDELQELKQRLSKLSDEELIEIVTVAAADYREEALDYAKAELKYRRVDWTTPEAAPEQEEPPVVQPGKHCIACGGELRPGTLVAEKELTIVFSDNQEERFVRVTACVRCGQLSLVADFDTTVEA